MTPSIRVLNPGTVFWITGLSGAGKTTVARGLQMRLVERGEPAILLDGDELRRIFNREDVHGEADRRRLARSYAALCKAIADQGHHVICATMSLFHDVQAWNRDNITEYREIYLDVSIEDLFERDPKGIYAKVRRGEMSEVVGLDLDFEAPKNPDLVIDNSNDSTPESSVSKILEIVGY